MSKINSTSKPELSFRKAAGEHKACWFVTAYVNDLPYQKRFSYKPEQREIEDAEKEFKHNYEGLNESTCKPVKVKPHHSEV